MLSIEIHTYSNNYQQPVIDLILPIQRDEFGVAITLEDQPDLQQIPGFYQKGKGNFWVATVKDEVAGTISLLDIGNRYVALRKMFVKKEYRGREWGLGQALLNTAMQWAKENEIENIYLGTTEKFLAAQRFYEKNGFEEIDKQLLPASFPVMSVDVKFYKFNIAR